MKPFPGAGLSKQTVAASQETLAAAQELISPQLSVPSAVVCSSRPLPQLQILPSHGRIHKRRMLSMQEVVRLSRDPRRRAC